MCECSLVDAVLEAYDRGKTDGYEDGWREAFDVQEIVQGWDPPSFSGALIFGDTPDPVQTRDDYTAADSVYLDSIGSQVDRLTGAVGAVEDYLGAPFRAWRQEATTVDAGDECPCLSCRNQ